MFSHETNNIEPSSSMCVQAPVKVIPLNTPYHTNDVSDAVSNRSVVPNTVERPQSNANFISPHNSPSENDLSSYNQFVLVS